MCTERDVLKSDDGPRESMYMRGQTSKTNPKDLPKLRQVLSLYRSNDQRVPAVRSNPSSQETFVAGIVSKQQDATYFEHALATREAIKGTDNCR